MKSLAFRTLGLALGAAIFAAGASAKDTGAAKPDPRIGEEVNKICFAHNINGWKEIDGEDDVVLLETGVNNWYRVELAGACPARVFKFAQAIGIDERPSGGCVSRGDAIVVEDTGNFTRRCYITKIYEWNDDLPPPADEAGESDKDEPNQ